MPAVRPAREGIYRIVRHGNHTHLVYALELPERIGELQEELNIGDEASSILSIKNTAKPSSRDAGLPGKKSVQYPKRLKKVFHDRQFGEASSTDFLNHPHTQFMLAAADDLGIELQPQHKTQPTAEIISDLKLEKSKHPLKPLFAGEWA